jgi:hypothetical protein
VERVQFAAQAQHQRFIYGLSEWFNQDALKEEYLKKVIYE